MEPISQPQKLLILSSGQIIDYLGVPWSSSIMIDDLETFLDSHIFEILRISSHLKFNGRSIMRISENIVGNDKLKHKVGE